MSARYAVIGDPVQHSLSPRLFSWLLEETGVGGPYDVLHVRPENLPAAVQRMRDGEYVGFSVTIPHKEKVISLVDSVDDKALTIGAANCLARAQDGRIRAFNTDSGGFRAALKEHHVQLRGSAVLILGAGGAARAAAFAAAWAGASKVSVANRSLGRAKDLVAALRRSTSSHADTPGDSSVTVEAVPLTQAHLEPLVDRADLLVNATSVGLNVSDETPLPAGLKRAGPVLDMVYRPLQTRLLRDAAAAGAPVRIDGLWMLVFQALEALKIWTGFEGDAALARRLHGFLSQEVS